MKKSKNNQFNYPEDPGSYGSFRNGNLEEENIDKDYLLSNSRKKSQCKDFLIGFKSELLQGITQWIMAGEIGLKDILIWQTWNKM